MTYTNREGFFPVVLSNDPTYSSDNQTLRADHSGLNSLAPALPTSKRYVTHLLSRNKVARIGSKQTRINQGPEEDTDLLQSVHRTALSSFWDVYKKTHIEVIRESKYKIETHLTPWLTDGLLLLMNERLRARSLGSYSCACASIIILPVHC